MLLCRPFLNLSALIKHSTLITTEFVVVFLCVVKCAVLVVDVKFW